MAARNSLQALGKSRIDRRQAKGSRTPGTVFFFEVIVLGAVQVWKAFLPRLLTHLVSGKQVVVVTTFSITGHADLNPGAYCDSKMALTSICEHLSLELDSIGAPVSSHSLLPTLAASAFLTGKTIGDFNTVGTHGAN